MGLIVVIFAFSIAIGLGVFLSGGAYKKTSSLQKKQGKKNTLLSDADIILLATEHQEGISIAAVCLATNTSTIEVKEKMESLREQGILYLRIDDNGAEKYTLTDTSLIDTKKKPQIKK